MMNAQVVRRSQRFARLFLGAGGFGSVGADDIGAGEIVAIDLVL